MFQAIIYVQVDSCIGINSLFDHKKVCTLAWALLISFLQLGHTNNKYYNVDQKTLLIINDFLKKKQFILICKFF